MVRLIKFQYALLRLALLNIHILSTHISIIVLVVIQELQTRQKLSIVGRKIYRGLSDVAITKDEDSRFVEWLIPGMKNNNSFFCTYFLQHFFCICSCAEYFLQIHLVWFMCGIEEQACLHALNFQQTDMIQSRVFRYMWIIR